MHRPSPELTPSIHRMIQETAEYLHLNQPMLFNTYLHHTQYPTTPLSTQRGANPNITHQVTPYWATIPGPTHPNPSQTQPTTPPNPADHQTPAPAHNPTTPLTQYQDHPPIHTAIMLPSHSQEATMEEIHQTIQTSMTHLTTQLHHLQQQINTSTQQQHQIMQSTK